ncbi:MAG: hypothetical protein WCC27_20135 [Acidobacteriaceae bacterium]
MRKIALRLIPVLLLPMLAVAQAAPLDPWAGWKFLLGEWEAGDSSGVPGAASDGGFTFEPELGGTVLVRKNHAEYPATKDHPAFSHDDLMVVYREGGATKALYDDSEGHVIHYDATVAPDGKQVEFVSEAGGGGPQFRLTYGNLGDGMVKVLFEIAPPDKPGGFARYVEATVRRKK